MKKIELNYDNDDELSIIANKYTSDKGTKIPNDGNYHGPRLFFTKIYDIFFNSLRNKEIKLLEIGIGSGPSLKMWYDYFPNATIYAIDVDNHSSKNNERVKTYVCDQSDRVAMSKLMKEIGEFDIIIDDGSHVVEHQQISLGYLFQYLKNGGQYWVEDLHTSDREVWQGKTLYGYDMSIKERESTVEVLEDYINNKTFKSPFMTTKEIDYLNENIVDMEMFELPKSHWGINKLALIKKK